MQAFSRSMSYVNSRQILEEEIEESSEEENKEGVPLD